MGCVDGIAGSFTIAVLNYVLLGFEFPVDGFYMHSFEIWLATTVVFFGSGTLGFTLLQYRLGEEGFVSRLFVSCDGHRAYFGAVLGTAGQLGLGSVLVSGSGALRPGRR